MIIIIYRLMVSLIVKTELPEIDIDLNNDQDINRYYNYIYNGVNTFHTQIQDDTIEKILGLVPYYLRDRFNYYMEDLLIEIKDMYTRIMKKAIVEYALQDPMEYYLLEVRLKLFYFIFDLNIFFITKVLQYFILLFYTYARIYLFHKNIF